MENKLLEIRDSGTTMVFLFIKLIPTCPSDCFLLNRSGYGRSAEDNSRYVIMINPELGQGEMLVGYCGSNDTERQYSDRLAVAHKYVEEHWDEIKPGEVIDIEFILGETPNKKISEIYYHPEYFRKGYFIE